MVLSSDHVTPATGKTVTVNLSKNGAAFAAALGAVTEIGNGWYSLAGNATDRGTLGELVIRASATGCDDTPDKYIIVPWDPFAAHNMGLDALPAVAANAVGGLPVLDANSLVDVDLKRWVTVAPNTLTLAGNLQVDVEQVRGATVNVLQAGRMDSYVGAYATGQDPGTYILVTPANKLATDASGRVTTTFGLHKNTAYSAFMFQMTDSVTHAPKPALTVSATRSLDGAAFAGCANSVVEISGGWYKLDLAAADLNANGVAFRFTATGADDRNILVELQL